MYWSNIGPELSLHLLQVLWPPLVRIVWLCASNKGIPGTGNTMLFESAIFIYTFCFLTVRLCFLRLLSDGAECRLCGSCAFHLLYSHKADCRVSLLLLQDFTPGHRFISGSHSSTVIPKTDSANIILAETGGNFRNIRCNIVNPVYGNYGLQFYWSFTLRLKSLSSPVLGWDLHTASPQELQEKALGFIFLNVVAHFSSSLTFKKKLYIFMTIGEYLDSNAN